MTVVEVLVASALSAALATGAAGLLHAAGRVTDQVVGRLSDATAAARQVEQLPAQLSNEPPTSDDHGSVLVLVLGVVTALSLTTAVLLQAAQTVLRRERSAWSTVVALSDVQSLERVVLDTLRRQPSVTCADLAAQPLPDVGNGSDVTLSCSGGTAQPWTVTLSAVHGPRSVSHRFVVVMDPDGRPVVQARSFDTAPNPALTNAA